jgi:tetratricopeptide (TPR) repeat protein
MSALVGQKYVTETRDGGGREIYTIHRALKSRLLKDLHTKAQERDEVFRVAFDLVRYHLPRPSLDTPEPAKWNLSKEYLPHVLALQMAYTDPLSITTPTPFPGLAELFKDGGVLLWQRYIQTDALRLLASAEKILDELESDDDDLRTDINITINLLLQYFGITHRRESKDRLGRILEHRKKIVEKKGPAGVTKEEEIMLNDAYADYATGLLQCNDYAAAEAIYLRCYSKYLELGTEDDPDRRIAVSLAKLNHHMAYCKMYRRQFDKAIELAEKAVAVIDTLNDKQMKGRYEFDLACIVLQSGDNERAEALHREILEVRLGLRGRARYFSLQSQYAYAAVLHYRGKLGEAE